MLDLKHLAALDAVVAAGSFRGAAAALGYAQSSVSQQIAALERVVGGQLLVRRGGAGPVRLTELGQLVAESGRELLERSRAAERRIAGFHAGGGRLDIATFQTVTNVLLPDVVGRLHELRPGCDIRLFEEESETPPIDGVDLAFFDGPAPPDSGAGDVLLLADPHVLVARRSAFPPGPVALSALHRRPLVALPPITTEREIEAVLHSSGIDPLIVFRTADNQGIVAMVRAGLGCAVMPLLAVDAAATDPQLAIHPLRPALRPRPIHLLWRTPLSPLASTAVDVITDVAARLRRTLADGRPSAIGEPGE